MLSSIRIYKMNELLKTPRTDYELEELISNNSDRMAYAEWLSRKYEEINREITDSGEEDAIKYIINLKNEIEDLKEENDYLAQEVNDLSEEVGDLEEAVKELENELDGIHSDKNDEDDWE